jgi:hypothetical protein
VGTIHSPRPTSPSRLATQRGTAALTFLAIFLCIWLGVVLVHGKVASGPNARAFGSDFSMFWTAARVLEHGGNAYDSRLLYQAAHAYFSHHGLPIMQNRTLYRVANPPLLFYVLRPVANLAFQPIAWAWVLLTYCLVALGCVGALRFLGWAIYAVPLLFFLAMPQITFGVFYGNLQGFIFASLVGSLVLARHNPVAAGTLASLVWLKPHVGLPFVLLIALFHVPAPRKFLAGFGAATVFLFAATVAATGWHNLGLWTIQLLRADANIGEQPNLASLTGLYDRWAPSPVQVPLESLTLTLACVLTAMWWWKYRRDHPISVSSTAWLWFVWFLAVPYAHFPDEIVLTIPLLAIIPHEGRQIDGRSALIVGLMAVSVVLFPRTPPYVDPISLPLLAIAVVLFLRARGFTKASVLVPDDKQALSPAASHEQSPSVLSVHSAHLPETGHVRRGE